MLLFFTTALLRNIFIPVVGQTQVCPCMWCCCHSWCLRHFCPSCSTVWWIKPCSRLSSLDSLTAHLLWLAKCSWRFYTCVVCIQQIWTLWIRTLVECLWISVVRGQQWKKLLAASTEVAHNFRNATSTSGGNVLPSISHRSSQWERAVPFTHRPAPHLCDFPEASGCPWFDPGC